MKHSNLEVARPRMAGLRIGVGLLAGWMLAGAGAGWAEAYDHTPRGTPYTWLNSYGLSTDIDDDDGDGRFTWQEFVAGGNPTNADDFAVSAIAMGPGSSVLVRWPSSSSGATDPYWLRFTTNLLQDVGDWPVIGISPRTPPVNTWAGTIPDPRGFLYVEAAYSYSPGVTLAIDKSSISEPAGVATVTATLSAPYYLPVGVQLALSGTAVLGADYAMSTTDILIPPGQPGQSATVNVLSDDLAEDPESVAVAISHVANGHEVGEQSVATTIASDDPRPPRIKVIKNATPDDPEDFAFTGDLGRFMLDDDADGTLPNYQWFGPLDPGNYDVSEKLMEGGAWDLAGIVVSDPDGGSTVDLGNGTATLDLDMGETVVVTFNNTKRGSVTVLKNAVPDSSWPFAYDGDLGKFTLVDQPAAPPSNVAHFPGLAPGLYKVSEDEVQGWNLAKIVVDDPDDGSSVDLANRTVYLDVDPGENVQVLFVNHAGDNNPPVAVAGGLYPTPEGRGVVLDASASSDPDEVIGDSIVRYEWDLNHDGIFERQAVPANNPILVLDETELAALGMVDGGAVYPVALRVTDAGDATGEDVAEIALVNVPPTVADLSLTPSVNEGGAVTLTGTIVDPGPDTFALQIDWGIGTGQYVDLSSPGPGVSFDPVSRVFAVSHVYPDDGDSPGNGTAWDLMLVGGVVIDDDGGMSTMSGHWTPMLANDDNDSGWTVTQQIQAGETIGQTFTAISGNPLATISLYLADMNASVAPADHSVTFALYEGTGSGGRLLGRREYTALADGFSGFVEVDFSSVTLQEGAMYTVALENDTARWGRVACGNQVAGGTALYAGAPSSSADALFRVQWQPDGAAPRLANENNESGWTVTQQIQAGEPIGQTFTAISGNPLATISMYLADMNASVAPTDYSVAFALYEGIGTTGRLLGRREYASLSNGFSGFVAADFSAVTLQEGATYTVVLENDTARWGRVACGNQVAGGTALYAGAPSPSADALFRVEWQPDGAAPRLANEDNESGWTVTQQIQAGEPIGQTFTAISGNPLAKISMYLADMNAGVAPADYSVAFKLYEGIGTSGRLLGQREYTALSDGFAGFVVVDFSAVTLQEGATYTVVLDNDTARWGRVACGNQYGGGTALYADAPSPSADALFRVEWQPNGAAPRLANENNESGWTVTQQIQAGEPIGQTFTAISDNPLAAVSMYLADMNADVAPNDYSVAFELYEGIGTAGRLLGRREYTALTDGFSGFVAVDFGSVTLAKGQTYTVVLANDTARWGRVACGNQYGGGTALYFDAPSPSADALFRVEWQPDGGAPRLANEDNQTGWTVTQQIQAGEPIGQTFTAISGSRLSTVSMYLADMNASVAPDDHSVMFELYEGIGTGGRLLGSREYAALTDDFTGFVTMDFSAVTLTEGDTYTLALRNDTARWGRVACGNQYGGGTALYADAPSPSADALFRVQWFPEPGRLATIVHNVDPAFEAGEDEALLRGSLYRKLEFTDPGVNDVHAVRVDYGDGSAVETIDVPLGERQFVLKHGYQTASGTKFTVTVTVADDDLGSCSDSFTVTLLQF